jgi:hypothetical protein
MTPGWAPLGRISQPASPGESPSRGALGSGSRSSSVFGLSLPFAGGPLPAFSATVDLIRSEHITAARANVLDKYILRELETEIERDCEALRGFLYATQVSSYPMHSGTRSFLYLGCPRLLTRYRRARGTASSVLASGLLARSWPLSCVIKYAVHKRNNYRS